MLRDEGSVHIACDFPALVREAGRQEAVRRQDSSAASGRSASASAERVVDQVDREAGIRGDGSQYESCGRFDMR